MDSLRKQDPPGATLIIKELVRGKAKPRMLENRWSKLTSFECLFCFMLNFTKGEST